MKRLRRRLLRDYRPPPRAQFTVPGQAAFLLEQLPRQSPVVRAQAYPELVKLDLPEVSSFMAKMYCDGTQEDIEALKTSIWRSDQLLEFLVREHLSPASHEDDPLAQRLVRFLNGEELAVPRKAFRRNEVGKSRGGGGLRAAGERGHRGAGLLPGVNWG